MAVLNEFDDILLQGFYGDISKDSWYLSKGASSHMTGIKTYLNNLDDTKNSIVRFGDGSTVNYEGQGRHRVQRNDENTLQLENVLYTPRLKTNIINSDPFDEQDCKIPLQDRRLTILNNKERLLATVPKTKGKLYKIKLKTIKECFMVEDKVEDSWLWHKTFCHLNYHTLCSMIKDEKKFKKYLL